MMEQNTHDKVLRIVASKGSCWPKVTFHLEYWTDSSDHCIQAKSQMNPEHATCIYKIDWNSS